MLKLFQVRTVECLLKTASQCCQPGNVKGCNNGLVKRHDTMQFKRNIALSLGISKQYIKRLVEILHRTVQRTADRSWRL